MVICIGLSKSALSTYITSKALKIRYTLKDCYSVDIHWLSETFGGDKIQNFDVRSTDGTTLFAI